VPTNTARTCPAAQGELSNYKNLLDEPEDHALGRSRGGLTTKIHALVDGNKRPLVLLIGPGQGGDAPLFENLMNALRVEKAGPGWVKARPDRAMADKAYSSKGIRSYLRAHGIQCVSPEKEDQKANRKRKGSSGGRPVS
jgi:putative transposase